MPTDGTPPTHFVLVTDTSEYGGQTINVCFKGTRDGQQCVVQTVDIKECVEPLSHLKIVNMAWQERFHTDKEMGYKNTGFAVIHESTAKALTPQVKVIDPDAWTVTLKQSESSPSAQLWINVEIIGSLLARFRAQAVSTELKALKEEAGSQNVNLTDADFARLMGVTTGVLSKALDRCQTENTPHNGKLVMAMEEKLASYRADIPSLIADIKRIQTEKESAKLQKAELAKAADGADDGDGNKAEGAQVFGKGAERYLSTFVQSWIDAKEDRSMRKSIKASIMDGVKTETTFDSSWWTDKQLEGKLKKMAAKVRKAARAGV